VRSGVKRAERYGVSPSIVVLWAQRFESFSSGEVLSQKASYQIISAEFGELLQAAE